MLPVLFEKSLSDQVRNDDPEQPFDQKKQETSNTKALNPNNKFMRFFLLHMFNRKLNGQI